MSGGAQCKKAGSLQHRASGQDWLETYEGNRNGVGSIMARKYLRGDHFLVGETPCSVGSPIWKGILAARFILQDGVRWKLGNGECIRFWEDKWSGPSKLEDLPIIGALKRDCESRYGSLVKHYWTGQQKDRHWRSFEEVHGCVEEVQRVWRVLDN